MSDLKPLFKAAKETLRAKQSSIPLKMKRQLQAIVKTNTLEELRDNVAVLSSEMLYYTASSKKCFLKKCANGLNCLKNKCGCFLAGTKLDAKTNKCISICKEGEAFINGKCSSICKPGTKFDIKTKSCVNVCNESETWLEGKCLSNC